MLPESIERERAMRGAQHAWDDVRLARTNGDRAGAIGRARLALDRLAEANIAERYAIAAERKEADRA